MSNIVKVQDYFKANIERIQEACSSVKITEQVIDAVQVVSKNFKLQSCNASSIVGAVITASRLGVSLDPNVKHSYLIPYGKECKLEISYMGLIDVIYRSTGGLIEAHMVYEKDFFEYQQGSNPNVTHKPVVFGDKGSLIGCYAICKIDDNFTIEFMDVGEIEKCKSENQSIKNGKPCIVWDKWYSEMAKKSVIRRLYKRLPKTRQTAMVASYDEKSAIGADTSEFIDIDGVELPPKENTPEQELNELTGSE